MLLYKRIGHDEGRRLWMHFFKCCRKNQAMVLEGQRTSRGDSYLSIVCFDTHIAASLSVLLSNLSMLFTVAVGLLKVVVVIRSRKLLNWNSRQRGSLDAPSRRQPCALELVVSPDYHGRS